MLELIIKRIENQRQIVLVENGKIVEYYEEGEEDDKNEGNIYIGVVKDIVKGMQAAFVDIGINKNSLIHLKDILEKKDEKKQKIDLNQEIEKLIQPNERLLVQIKKDSNEKKGARKVLTAAALTYVASAASALLQLLRILILTGGRRNDDE